jgi:hypothetical protein
VGTRQQRDIAILNGEIFNAINQLTPVWQDHFITRGFQH